MVTYIYTAKNQQTGEEVKAEVQAENQQAAAKLLINQQLFPITIEEKSKATSILKKNIGKHVRMKERLLFTRQLATLINAGLPILQSLRTIEEQVTSARMKQIVADVVADVEGGSSLADAFAKHPAAFSETFVSLTAAGEASGSLDKTLERVAYQMEKDSQIRSKIRGALVYPIIVLFVIVAVVVFLLTVVLPQIGLIYKDFNKELPLATKVLLGVSSAVTKFWWLSLILLLFAGYALYNYSKTPPGKKTIDLLKLRAPLFGGLFQKVYMARFCRGMSTLLASGVPMLNAIEIIKGTINNKVIADSLDTSTREVKGGKALSQTLENNKYFHKVVPQMTKIGEQSGAIDTILDKLATYFEEEIDEQVKGLSTAVEPALMIVMGLTVGFIMAAVLLPIYGLISGGLQ